MARLHQQEHIFCILRYTHAYMHMNVLSNIAFLHISPCTGTFQTSKSEASGIYMHWVRDPKLVSYLDMREIGIFHEKVVVHCNKGIFHLHTECKEDSLCNARLFFYFLPDKHTSLYLLHFHLYILASKLLLIFIFRIHQDNHIYHWRRKNLEDKLTDIIFFFRSTDGQEDM